MIGALVMLRLVRKVVMRTLFKLVRGSSFVVTAVADDDDLGPLLEDVPEDVKEGHFVVYTIEPKRFVIELDYLAHPGFLKLLQQAEEEFGFEQPGVLAIPCDSNELQRILENQEDGYV